MNIPSLGLVVFLVLFGLTSLVETKIPGWLVGVTALAAAAGQFLKKGDSK